MGFIFFAVALIAVFVASAAASPGKAAAARPEACKSSNQCSFGAPATPALCAPCVPCFRSGKFLNIADRSTLYQFFNNQYPNVKCGNVSAPLSDVETLSSANRNFCLLVQGAIASQPLRTNSPGCVVVLGVDVEGIVASQPLSLHLQDATLVNGFTGSSGPDVLVAHDTNLRSNTRLGGGADKVFLSDTTVNGVLDTGVGDDIVVLTNSLLMEILQLGAGNDKLHATGGGLNAIATDEYDTNPLAFTNKVFISGTSVEGKGFISGKTCVHIEDASLEDDFEVSGTGMTRVEIVNTLTSNFPIGVSDEKLPSPGSTVWVLQDLSDVGGLSGGAGADTFCVFDSEINGDVELFGGNDILFAPTSIVTGDISGGSGKDRCVVGKVTGVSECDQNVDACDDFFGLSGGNPAC